MKYIYIGKIVNTHALKSIDLSNVIEIRDLAFGNAISLESVNLSKVEFIGMDAFTNAQSLTTVVLNENLTELSQGTFFNCISLKTINTENLTLINASAFAGCTSLTRINLESAEEIEEMAFYGAGLARASLPAAKVIGDYAFYGSKVTLLTMPIAEKIGYMSFTATSLTGNIELPTTLTYIGGLAFADNMKIKAFVFKDNGKQVNSGKVNDYIYLDGGVLYTKISDGYQLVCYPEAKTDEAYTVMEGTTKIGTYAVAFQPNLKEVTLPYTLNYIADFAFAECEQLTTFKFLSYKAPVLEGIYNSEYEYATEYYDAQGNKTQVTDAAVEVRLSDRMLEMYKYSLYYEIYYYSNFIGYVGQVEGLTIEYPSNGLGYDGLIYNWFFDNKVESGAVMSDITLAAYNAIAALKDAKDITLDDETAVTNARVLYSYIDANDSEQLDLITNYQRLVEAEAKIKELKPVIMEEETQLVFDMIENLKDPEDLEWIDRYDVEEVRAFYNLITDEDQLAFITNVDKLLAAEAKIEELRAIQTLPSNVLEVYNAINALPETITLEDETAILSAREKFDALSESEQGLLAETIKAKLVKAENDLAALKEVTKPAPGNDSNATAYIVIGIGVLVVAGGVFFFLKKKKSK